MNVLCFVSLLLIVCWNQNITSVKMYKFGVNPVFTSCWNICMAWLFASTKPVNSSFRGNPCLSTKLYSLKCKVSLVWYMWVAHEFQAIFLFYKCVHVTLSSRKCVFMGNIKYWPSSKSSFFLTCKYHLVFTNTFWLTCISNVSLWNGESVGPAVYRTFSSNHLSYTKTLVPIYIFRAITFLEWCHHFLRKNGLFASK